MDIIAMEQMGSGTQTGGSILSCRNLWKIFGASADQFHAIANPLGSPQLAAKGWVPAVQDVSLDIARSEVFVVMGLSGSGKSTLVRLLSRLIEPTAGELLLDGRDLMQISARELMQVRRAKMGMVFQHFALLPNRTVRGNITFPLEIRGMPRVDHEARASELIELVGLTGRENNFPSQLSGGQQQRVGIARSLAGDPEIWFLDEPFSALDPLIRADLQNELLRLQQHLAKTVVFITHDLDEAIKLADRIAIMENGRLIQVATPEDLVLHPASDYVRRFTANVPLAKVVKLGTLADRSRIPPATAMLFSSTRTVEQVASQVIDCDGSIGITDDTGIVGQLDREQIFRVLAGLGRAV